MPDLKSSNLASCDHDAATDRLVIRFHNGGVYTYSDVPASVYEGLLSAPSPGRYFAEQIKGVYTYKKG